VALVLGQVDDREILSKAVRKQSRKQKAPMLHRWQTAKSALLLAMRSPSVRRASACRA
jgi:hypothetical protein